MKVPVAVALSLALSTFASAPTHAGDPRPAVPYVDVEIDPLAYALAGHSLHVGLGWDHVRLDLGAFALDVPSFFHGNDGFSSSFTGYGAKLQWFPFARQHGLFLGVSAGAADRLVELDGSHAALRETRFSAGVAVGGRIPLGAGFYVTPWIGVDYAFGAGDITLEGKTYEQGPVSFFPTVHLGYRFR